MDRPTLRLGEVALVDASLERLVEERVELSLRRHINLVVGLDVFLDCLSAAYRSECVSIHEAAATSRGMDLELTCYHFSP